jgi:hypothetical protein
MVCGKGKGGWWKKWPYQKRKKIIHEERIYLKGALDFLAPEMGWNT